MLTVLQAAGFAGYCLLAVLRIAANTFRIKAAVAGGAGRLNLPVYKPFH
jgi:propanediol dehydratase small subunit